MVLLIPAVNQGEKCQGFLTFAVTSKVSRWAAQPELLYAQPFKKIWCLLLPTGTIKFMVIRHILHNCEAVVNILGYVTINLTKREQVTCTCGTTMSPPGLRSAPVAGYIQSHSSHRQLQQSQGVESH